MNAKTGAIVTRTITAATKVNFMTTSNGTRAVVVITAAQFVSSPNSCRI